METTFSFGAWVRGRRRALDLTQSELARRVGCAEVTIQKIEADERKPSIQIAELLAEHLCIPPDERPTFVNTARGTSAVERLPPPNALEAPNTSAPPARPPPCGTISRCR